MMSQEYWWELDVGIHSVAHTPTMCSTLRSYVAISCSTVPGGSDGHYRLHANSIGHNLGLESICGEGAYSSQVLENKTKDMVYLDINSKNALKRNNADNLVAKKFMCQNLTDCQNVTDCQNDTKCKVGHMFVLP